MKKTLIVLEGNCGEEGQQYRRWLEKNHPDDIQLDFRPGCTGVGGGIFDATGDEIEDDDLWWSRYCNSIAVE